MVKVICICADIYVKPPLIDVIVVSLFSSIQFVLYESQDKATIIEASLKWIHLAFTIYVCYSCSWETNYIV